VEDEPDEVDGRGRSVAVTIMIVSVLLAIFLALAELASAWILILLPAATAALIGFHRVLLGKIARWREAADNASGRRD
jgi:hypothetical protein